MSKKLTYISYDYNFLSLHSHEIIANFVELGMEVHLFVPDNVQTHAGLHSKCKIHKVPVISNKALIQSISYQIILIVFFLIGFFEKDRPDMIYARQNYLGLLPILLARMYRIPYFAEFNNITRRVQYSLTNIKLLIKNVFEYSCLKAANIIITPSLTLKNRIIQRYKILPNKIYVVSNGVNEELFHPNRHVKVTRNKLGLNDSDFVVGFVGSMGEWQGIEVLKKAIMFTLDEYDKENIKFLIVGDYDKDSNLTRIKAGLGQGQRDIVTFIQTNFLESNVFYQSHVSYEDSADYMKICDVLVAPYMRSSIEYGGGSPLKLYAYLGCEKSVIISDLGDFTDSSCLRKYEAAFLVHPDDGHAIKDAIIILKKNKKLREKLSRNGRDFVLKRRRWSHSCSKLKSIYEHEFGH